MIKYVVYWCLVTFVSEPCPDVKNDPWGRENSATTCAVYHGSQVKTCGHSKEFDTKEEAEDFWRRSLKQEGVYDVVLDSIKHY